jgi:hypothetical protein
VDSRRGDGRRLGDRRLKWIAGRIQSRTKTSCAAISRTLWIGRRDQIQALQMSGTNKVLQGCVLQLIYFSRSPPLSKVQVVSSTIPVESPTIQVNYLRIQEATAIQVNYSGIQVNYAKIQVNYLKIQEDTEVPNGWPHDPSELPGDPSELSQDTRGYRSSHWMAPRY